ncbi:MAG: hypothetical protein ACJAX6_000076 [Limisphaerales bacterium]|jgi:hypothetical protein
MLGHTYISLLRFASLNFDYPSGGGLDTLGHSLSAIPNGGRFFAAKKGYFCFDAGS